ncbi:N-acetyltransferase [Paraliobacillus quinghaiensis]|uniref:N-acetyltransferase n=1 Tax=Paraliobacillus quinghaiensis TaxID=470815 RepID=A0A917TFH8_9BACI|nr:GNAT family protein [Paraliobacillus quinghaiensis]GGM20762.1 N-acetyltransferase [Paraliobacillus quinghaiensis]
MSKQLNLRAFEEFDIEKLHSWFNDTETLSMIGRTPMTYEETKQHVSKLRNEKTIIMCIENQEKQIGWTHLSNISHEHGRAEIGVLLAPEYRGKGYGEIAMESMIELGFNQLRLNKIFLTTRGINERAIALYKKIGFKVEGNLREHCFINGKYYDTIFMGLLFNEWKK